MAEGGEGPRPPSPVEKLAIAVNAGLAIKPETSGGEISAKRLRQSITLARESWTNLYGRDLTSLPYDERQAVEAAIALGYGPSHITGKGIESPAAKDVVTNSLLSEPERIVKAEELLNQEISFKQREALLKAHNTGAGVFRNSRLQLEEKVRILKNEGFSTKEIRTIIEAGLAAHPIPPDTYTDPKLINIVAELNADTMRNGDGNPLESHIIQEQRTRVRNLLDQGLVDPVQAADLIRELNSWMDETRAAIDEARERAGRARYFAEGVPELILTSEEEREHIFEEIFVGVDSNPGSAFQASLSLEASGKLDEFFTLLSRAEVYDSATGRPITNDPNRIAEVAKKREQLFQEFSGKRQIRQILHDANWSVSVGGGNIEAFAQTMATFQSEHIDLIFQDPLVATALRMFEQAFQQIKAENKGQLPYEQLAWNYKTQSSNLEDRVWTLMRDEIRLGVISSGVPEWQLRRAIILARGFGVASLRFPEIAAQARLPEETTFADATERASRFGSIYGEAIARYLDPLEHIIEKFAIGYEDRAFLYYFLTGDKKNIQSVDQLKEALEMASNLKGKDKRLIDIINIFRIGGGFSNSSWRTFMSMRGFTDEQRRRSGIGILEGRVSGDVDDIIRAEVAGEQGFAAVPNETSKQKEAREKAIRKEIKRRIDGDKKKDLVLDKRIEMWKDALKANPLRVMWQWEEIEPGKRIEFLSQALGISETEAKTKLPQVEQDLMIIQENTVLHLGVPEFLPDGTPNPDHIKYTDAEMLKYDIIGGNNPTQEDMDRRVRVENYVKKIRNEASANEHEFIKGLFAKTGKGSNAVEKTPFPFVIGFEDIPFSDFNFINTGGRGFARRINDYANSVNATNELMGLITKIPKAHDIGPLIESLDKIKQMVSQYDKTIAMEVVPYLARGIIKMYDKDLMSRMPLGIGTLTGMINDSSFIQKQYGRAAMAWDEGDKFNFTTQLLHNGLVSKKDLEGLRKDIGATPVNLTVDILRTYGQLALLLLLYGFAKSVASDK